MTHCKSRKIDDDKSKTCKPVETIGQDVKSDIITVPSKRKLILKRAELPLAGKSVIDVKKGVTKKYQYWIDYPRKIMNNLFRVVQSDTKTHYFDGFRTSYCTRYKCGTVKQKRPGVNFFKDVPKDVSIKSFCFFCKNHQLAKGGGFVGLRSCKRPYLPAIPTDGMGKQ